MAQMIDSWVELSAIVLGACYEAAWLDLRYLAKADANSNEAARALFRIVRARRLNSLITEPLFPTIAGRDCRKQLRKLRGLSPIVSPGWKLDGLIGVNAGNDAGAGEVGVWTPPSMPSPDPIAPPIEKQTF
jgi:hypothetical protein